MTVHSVINHGIQAGLKPAIEDEERANYNHNHDDYCIINGIFGALR